MSRSSSAAPWRARWLVRGALATLLLLAVGGGVLLLATVPPTDDTFYPRCQLHTLTGLHCPGCGTTRAVHAALNGRFAQALAYNALAVVVLPVFGAGLLRSLRIWRSGPSRQPIQPPPRFETLGLRLLVVAVVFYGALRNLPWFPFTLLAPHEI